MKLLYCPHCHDVRKLRTVDQIENFHTDTKCMCGRSWGHYTDNINAVYGGDAVMLGFSNPSMHNAIDMNALLGGSTKGGILLGRQFEAFIIPESAPTVRREFKRCDTCPQACTTPEQCVAARRDGV